jgi:hypothetical protein
MKRLECKAVKRKDYQPEAVLMTNTQGKWLHWLLHWQFHCQEGPVNYTQINRHLIMETVNQMAFVCPSRLCKAIMVSERKITMQRTMLAEKIVNMSTWAPIPKHYSTSRPLHCRRFSYCFQCPLVELGV